MFWLLHNGGAQGLEVNVISKYPGVATSDNASTAHNLASVLRVGGEYAGGGKTIHDVGNGEIIMVSSTVEDAFWSPQTLHQIGNGGTDAIDLTYGDLTYAGDFVDDFVTVLLVVKLESGMRNSVQC